MFRRTAIAGLILSATLGAALQRIEVLDRTDVLDGKSFGSAGPYERIVAKAFFAVDPALPANRIIADIALAPRNDQGLVEFSADLYVLKPRDSKTGNGTVLFEVSNRGGKGMLRMFDFAESSTDPQTAAQFGDEFLLEQGYALVWLGWQPDVPRRPDLVRLYAPIAPGVTGLVRSEYVPDKKVTRFSLADRTMEVVYPVLDPKDPSIQLTVRDTVDGPRRVVPRANWSFEGATHVTMPDGFEPGKLYDLAYRSKDPVLAGLGPAAVRDLISFLKYGGTPGQGAVMFVDQRRFLKRAIGFGISQSGRFLRTFLYYGFNQDEKARKVFDGVLAHVAGGGRGSFNHRFAQPSRDGHPFLNTLYPTDIFPFTDLPETDPETGLTEGLLDRAGNATPKIFYTNSSYEYYGRAASLIHTAIDGKADAPLAKDTRVYLIAGTQHGPAAFPPQRGGARNLANPNDYRFALRALLAAMNQWLTSDKEPPPSVYPRIAGDKLVPIGALRFPKLPGAGAPTRIQRAWRADYGPDFRTKGIVSIEPPKLGSAFPLLVPQVDTDGNETSGIRLPEIAAPLAAYTGWNLRTPELGAPDELFSMVGSWIPFARTKAEREKARDPRPSIEERYKGREDYLERVAGSARELIKAGYVLERDLPRIVELAGQRWDHLMSR